jgi:DNA-binding IclR family transcriptional regulator
MGRAILGTKPDDELLRWVRRCNAEAKDVRFRVKEPDYLSLISEIRSNGFAETAGDISDGFGAIAVAMPSPLGGQPLAIGAGARLPRLSEKRNDIISGLRQALNEISNASDGRCDLVGVRT